jgi:2-aminoethylphosphonate-pyruvate transaminase
MMTGPYHAIASLDNVLANHDDFREAVVENKKIFTKRMAGYLTRPEELEPLLCTHVRCKMTSGDKRASLYSPRTDFGGSVVCHLGEVHLGRAARGEIISLLEICE